MESELAEACIYTIVHRDRLSAAEQSGLPATFMERRPWTSGRHLWMRACACGASMAVLFSDACDCTRLEYWGLLTDVTLTEHGTSYTVDQVRKLPPGRTPQDLRLLKSGQTIAPGYIRPYAICQTPEFIPE